MLSATVLSAVMLTVMAPNTQQDPNSKVNSHIKEMRSIIAVEYNLIFEICEKATQDQI